MVVRGELWDSLGRLREWLVQRPHRGRLTCMFEVGGKGHAAGKKQGGMSKEGREIRGPQSAVAGSQTEEGTTRIALVSHLRASSWTDATQLQQDPNGWHWAASSIRLLNDAASFHTWHFTLSSMCLRDSSWQVWLLGCTFLILVDTALLPLKRLGQPTLPPGWPLPVHCGLACSAPRQTSVCPPVRWVKSDVSSRFIGASRGIQWLGLCAPNAGGPGSISDHGTRVHRPQLRVLMLEIPLASTKTLCATTKT